MTLGSTLDLRSNAIRLAMVGLMAAFAVACSTAQPPKELDSARRAYDAAAADPNLTKYASVPLYEAKKDLDRATAAWDKDKDADEVAHIATLAGKRVKIAETVAEGAKARADRETLLKSREQIQLQARDKEIADLESLRVSELESRDKEIAELKAEHSDEGMVLTLGGDVLFKTGGSIVSPGAQASLDRVVQFLDKNADREVVISGHTDSTGGLETNRILSEKRAAAVGGFLVSRGISQSRIATRGFGSTLPLAANETAEGRQQNRRVDIMILNAGEKAAEHVLAKP